MRETSHQWHNGYLHGKALKICHIVREYAINTMFKHGGNQIGIMYLLSGSFRISEKLQPSLRYRFGVFSYLKIRFKLLDDNL